MITVFLEDEGVYDQNHISTGGQTKKRQTP